ncbi:MAG: hypothetical protein QOG10_3762 [Kribbellaceae bacterium]|nr:hypothetical protein [Kribbellaceae bacterium]
MWPGLPCTRVQRTPTQTGNTPFRVRRTLAPGLRPHVEQSARRPRHTSPSPQLLDYATSKAAILNFIKGLAQELAPKSILVNAVAPGPIWTALVPATMPPDEVKQFGADTPLGRPGQPAELAPAYVFLASGDSSYITGERIGITGGKPAP